MYGADSQAVNEKVCSGSTWSNLSYVDLQSYTPYFHHLQSYSADEYSISPNQIPYPESLLPGYLGTNGERRGQTVRAPQQDCKRSTFTSTESESVKVHPQSNQCTPATVTKMSVASQLRSYTVETANCYNGAQLVYYNGAQLVRNRHFISPAQESALIPVKNVKPGCKTKPKSARNSAKSGF